MLCLGCQAEEKIIAGHDPGADLPAKPPHRSVFNWLERTHEKPAHVVKSGFLIIPRNLELYRFPIHESLWAPQLLTVAVESPRDWQMVAARTVSTEACPGLYPKKLAGISFNYRSSNTYRLRPSRKKFQNSGSERVLLNYTTDGSRAFMQV